MTAFADRSVLISGIALSTILLVVAAPLTVTASPPASEPSMRQDVENDRGAED